jgi:hypothetical protein
MRAWPTPCEISGSYTGLYMTRRLPKSTTLYSERRAQSTGCSRVPLAPAQPPGPSEPALSSPTPLWQCCRRPVAITDIRCGRMPRDGCAHCGHWSGPVSPARSGRVDLDLVGSISIWSGRSRSGRVDLDLVGTWSLVMATGRLRPGVGVCRWVRVSPSGLAQ